MKNRKSMSISKSDKRLLTAAAVMVCILLLLIFSPVKGNRKKSEQFKNYKPYFEEFNAFMEDYYSNRNEEEAAIYLSKNESNIITHYSDANSPDIEFDEENYIAINKIKNAFRYDFSVVSVSRDRISYGGEGYERYVYLKKGLYPKYFIDPNEKVNFFCYALGDGWFYLELNVR